MSRLLLCWLAALPCLAAAAGADRLPPESVVPGQASPPGTLPSEAAVPGAATPPLAAADRLPPENLLPPGVAAAAAVPAAEVPDAIGLDDSPDRRPWLRLALPGHTAGIRSMAFTSDSTRLCTAGDDKSVIVWRRHPDPPGGTGGWIYERTIRWQIQRGPRGRIYALAASSSWLALAGDSAMDQVRIVLVDPATGQWKASLLDDRVGPHPIVVALASSPDEQLPGLVSMEMDGRATYWSPEAATGLWRPRQLQAPDREQHGAAEAARLLAWRRVCPVAMLNGRLAVLPQFAGRAADGQPQWRLQIVDVSDGTARNLGGEQASALHARMVLALAASADGRRVVSADDAGRLFLFDAERGGGPQRFQMAAPVISLGLSGDGQNLVLGGYRSRSAAGADLQRWDVSSLQRPRNLASTRLDEHVVACALSPDGRFIAAAQGPAVELAAGGVLDRNTALRAPARPPQRVAFARQPPLYRLAFGYGPELTHTFDTAAVQLGRGESLDQEDWIPSTWWRGDWSLLTVPAGEAGAEETYWLTRGGRQIAPLPLRPSVEGAPAATCWIPDRQGQPAAVAVGTDGQNNIYVFRLVEQNSVPLLRMFRGHAAAVRSLGVSRDLRYLASAGDDSTIRVWPLREVLETDEVGNRWGADLAVEDGVLRVSRLREDGPLFFRGMRVGDGLSSLQWRGADGVTIVRTPGEMLQALRVRPWDETLLFEHVRAGNLTERFQIFPAWQQLVSLVVADNREWAWWTPAGYYDASFEGHKLFGWQVNRGAERAPDFFLAAQLRQQLERPDIMSRLLEAGSLEEAFRAARLEPPANSQRAIQDQYAAKPRVTIRAPDPAQAVAAEQLVIEAVITVPPGEQGIPPKAFANGVLAGDRQLVDRQSSPDGLQLVYRWTAQLPADPQILLQVVAATQARVTDTAQIVLQRAGPPVRPPARLFVVAAGVNQYQDAQLPRLDFAVANALQFTQTLETGASGFYRTQASSLLDQHVTRPVWQVNAEHYAGLLRQQVSPDDLLVIFLSGHGLRDPQADQYYFVTADARFRDLMARQFADCLAFQDLAAFTDVPCRKLVILDTCHSGAIQPLRQQHLKAALRALQDDLVFTITASEGSQEAVETRDRQLGRFTSRLIEALEGRADQQAGNRDGVVTLDEAVEYVQRMVTADSAADPTRQYPTAGPAELLPYARLPLTSVR